MKILHIFPYLPTPANSGGAMRIYHILKHLCKHHDVTVAGFRESGDLALFKRTFPELQGKMHFLQRRLENNYHRLLQLYSLFTPHSYWYNWAQSGEFEDQLNRLIEEDDYDIILSEFASMGHFQLKTDAIRILDAHNVEYDNFRRMSMLEWSRIRKRFYTREYKKCFKEEVAIFNQQQAIFTTSRRDGDIIRKDAQDIPQFVIPNGVDTEFFKQEKEVDTEPCSMVFTGTMSYVPNSDGMIYFLDHIFPLIKKTVPAAKVYVVGSNPPAMLKKYQSESVQITGFVDDVRPYINKASIYIVPLNMGSGTRLKVVEALSMKKPIVSTSIGSEGIEIRDGVDLLIRDDPESFAEAVISLMKDSGATNKLVENGYELVRKKYDWKVIGDAIEEAFLSLTEMQASGGQLDLQQKDLPGMTGVTGE